MIYTIIAAVLIVADYITKLWAERVLTKISSIPLIENVFHLTYVENRGIAFGMFSGGRVVFIAVSLIVMAVLLIIVFKTPKDTRTVWLKGGASLVIAGAIGNLIERLVKGYVVDFFDFRLINFPVFNVADIAVCVGVVMLLIHFLFAEDSKSE
ncbi:MAG: signal peptidase II [Clostridiales bacterium]|nr:signal peptidase II [Clostridiales bacterium]